MLRQMRAAGWFVVAAGFATAQEPPERPNLVIILADDLGYGDPGCYNDQSKVPTPHIDRLAREGVRFTDAHSPSSVCTPTRYALLTGRYAWRTALERSVLWPWDPPLLEDERVTLPELLRDAGYDTACIGKWHLGWDWPLGESSSVARELDGHTWPPERREEIGARVSWDRPVGGGPLAHGFDHYFGDDVPNFPPYAFLEDDRVVASPASAKPDDMFGHPGPAVAGWDLAAVLPRLAERAAQWIDARTSERPFFLYLPLTSPHTPIAPAAEFVGKSGAGAYGDFVHETDWVVGQVLAALDRNDFADHTLVIFTSDNGSPQRDGTGMSGAVGSVRERHGHDPSRPWRGLKSDAWEGGHRVPFLARWPGRVSAGRVSDQPLVHVDMYRTLANLVGSEVGVDDGEDSFDVAGALFAGGGEDPVRDHLVHHSGNGTFAIRVGSWKLILGRASGGFSTWKPPADAPPGQLYDLARDPGETDNVYRDHPEIVAELTAQLEQIRTSGRSAPLRVLLLGDSISIGYTAHVAELMGRRAHVARAQKPNGRTENCAGTTHGVQHLSRWLAQDSGAWDVIHFNFGLHDLKRVLPETGKNSNDPDHPHQATPEVYETQLRAIVADLRETGARLVFATTTPVPLGVRPYRAPEDAMRYNEVATRVMREHGIAINDLHAFALPRLSELQKPRDVHFTAEGSKALAGEVVAAIRAVVER